MEELIIKCSSCGFESNNPLKSCSCKIKKEIYDKLRKSSYADLQKNVFEVLEILPGDET